jgi:predicted LPLAT superfamily acyltransferase
LLGSHLGNLEVCRVIADFDKTIHINVLLDNKHAQKFNQLLKQTSDNSQLNLIQITEITAATSMVLRNKINNGELVIIAADRTPVSNQQRVTKVTFMGADALFPQGPFILASLLECPVYTVFCLKQHSKNVIYFDLFSDSLMFPRKTREEAMQKMIQRYAECLQTYCLKEPLQWFNFFDFWHSSYDE